MHNLVNQAVESIALCIQVVELWILYKVVDKAFSLLFILIKNPFKHVIFYFFNNYKEIFTTSMQVFIHLCMCNSFWLLYV